MSTTAPGGSKGYMATMDAGSELLDRCYSEQEVHAAFLAMVEYTASGVSCPNETALVVVDAMWDVMHVLTSDYVWGGGPAHLVNAVLKLHVEHFMSDLLINTEPLKSLRESPSVANFVASYMDRLEDPGFQRILRAYIYAFPESANMPPDTWAQPDELQSTLHMCIVQDIPLVVMKTLLEGGLRVDPVNRFGETPLMLAMALVTGVQSLVKIQQLLDYGADIGVFDREFQNPLHLAVSAGNVRALRAMLGARHDRLAASASLTHATRLRKTGPMSRDPLHMPDENNETALSLAVGHVNLNYKARKHMIDMLLEAGADADCDLDHEARIAAALSIDHRTCGALPCYGMINVYDQTYLEDDSFVMSIQVRKDIYYTTALVNLSLVLQCVDRSESVLPPVEMTSFDLEMVFLRCMAQQFDFAGGAGVDGVDFDL
ncbi:hypothetical protein T484DRAFT_1754954 [Baffinella frigidus]|nr:hypothetical protein T484DRAFT_1754954 [Cryptophyta sp. CCMP2293]